MLPLIPFTLVLNLISMINRRGKLICFIVLSLLSAFSVTASGSRNDPGGLDTLTRRENTSVGLAPPPIPISTITVTGSLTSFTTCAGTPSGTQTLVVSGTGLISDVIATAVTGYELSTSSAGPFSASLSLSPVTGTLNSTTIYIRLTNSAANGASGNIAFASTGATTQNVATGIATVNTLPASGITISPGLQCSGFANYFNGPSACGSNPALNFSGTSAGSRPILTNATDNITMEIWAKWNAGSAGGNQILFYNGHTGNGGYGILTGPTGILQILVGGLSYLVSSATLTVGIWQHVAIVRNAGTWSLYLNGTQFSVSSNTVNPRSPSTAAGNQTSIGYAQDGGQRFFGALDEAKFWTNPRSTVQILSDMKECSATPAAGLTAYWSFNEGSGTTAADGSGNNNTLTLSNTSWITTGAPTGGTYLWDFGDGSTSVLGADTHVYNTAGANTVTLTVTNVNGCTSTSTSPVTVNQSPTAGITGVATSCNTTVTLTASGGPTYQWSGGNSTGTAINTFSSSGNYTVTVMNAAGCTGTATQSVTINSLPALPVDGALPVVTNFVTGLNGPTGLAFNASGNLFVAEQYTGSIRKITPAGVITSFVTSLNTPMAIAFDASANLYVAQQSTGVVSKITTTGVVSSFASGLGSAVGLAFNTSGDLFVSDQSGNLIKKVTPLRVVSSFATGLNRPQGLAFNASGILFVPEQSNNLIKKVTSAGIVSSFATGLSGPTGLAFDASGNLYVADQFSSTIKKITPAGVVSTFVSGLSSPMWIAFDATGNLFVSDGSSSIKKITFPALNITSVVNSGSVTLVASVLTNETVDWYDAATGGNVLLLNSTNYTTPIISSTTTYYAQARKTLTGCISATRRAITVNVVLRSMVNSNGKITTDLTNSVSQYGQTVGSGVNINGKIIQNVPVLSATSAATSINSNTAISGGTILSNGGAAITASGVCWSLTVNPTIANSKTSNGTAASFTSNLTGLTSGATYYVRAYATNSEGTSYATGVSFTTQ
ncbi:MAG: inlA [Ferruginibacter sp.]|nr:inlA [Ferruginibacter sp.]